MPVSCGLAKSAIDAQEPLLYLKPVQTGFPEDSDAALVASVSGASLSYGSHASKILGDSAISTPTNSQSSSVEARLLHAWRLPASPHLAVSAEGRIVSNEELRRQVCQELLEYQKRCSQKAMALVETAGGPASPSPSGQLQCDVLRPLRLPGVLVGDGRLGGISSTIAARECLLLRGYDLAAIVLMDDGLANWKYLREHFGNRVPVVPLPPCRPPPHTGRKGEAVDEALQEWLQLTRQPMTEIRELLQDYHKKRVARLLDLGPKAGANIWWPTTQHSLVQGKDVQTIDARSGEHFSVLASDSRGGRLIESRYDGCASWWTQGLNDELQPRLTQALAYAAARYGHVMHPENAHEPAVACAEALLGGVGRGWADRVFFSADGSSAVEIALKMAFRTYMHSNPGAEQCSLEVVGLVDGYHGDTLGCMDAVAPSVYNGPRQTPWYKGRGLFISPVKAALVRGKWQVASHANPSDGPPSWGKAPRISRAFDSLEDLFDRRRWSDDKDLVSQYETILDQELDRHERERGAEARLAACIVEPLVQGANCMQMVDPLFQSVLAQRCRERGMLVIFDEIFAGLWRLGTPTAWSRLGLMPDIACYAKLLTGGMVPLAATLASKQVFEAFLSPNKIDALLHGHSYSGYPIGCAVAVEALKLYSDAECNPALCTPHKAGRCQSSPACAEPCGRLVELWDEKLLKQLSMHDHVARIVALGTLVAAEIQPGQGQAAGYGSHEAKSVVMWLRQHGVYARPLGNVVYLMVTPTTHPSQSRQLLVKLMQAIDVHASRGASNQGVHAPAGPQIDQNNIAARA
ncbi:g3060 [Coccomyxa elongata]